MIVRRKVKGSGFIRFIEGLKSTIDRFFDSHFGKFWKVLERGKILLFLRFVIISIDDFFDCLKES